MDPRLMSYLGKKKDPYLDILNRQEAGQAQAAQQMQEINDRPQTDYNQYAALAKAMAQIGTIGGRAADTGAVEQAAQGYQGMQDQRKKDLLNQVANREGDIDRNTGLQLKTLEYLQTQKDKQLARSDAMQQRRDMLEMGRQNKQADYDRNLSDKLAENLKKDLDPMTGTGNLAKAKDMSIQADRLLALTRDVGGGKGVRDLTEQEIHELATGFNRMLSGGVGAASQIEALVPRSLRGDVNGMIQWISNNPTGTGQKAFVERMAHSIEREKAVNDDIIKKGLYAKLPAYQKLKQTNPELYGSILQGQGLDPNGPPPPVAPVAPLAHEAAPTMQGGPKPGVIEDGHRFKGGNPADPNNWEKL